LSDYVGAYLSAGGKAVYYFHYMPLGIHPQRCDNSPGSFGLFSTDKNLKVKQPLSQFFASQLINLDWMQPGSGEHKLFPASSDIRDAVGDVLVTTYAAERPDGRWSLLVVNKDQENAHRVRIDFRDLAKDSDAHFAGQVDVITFGSEQYQWHPNVDGGSANPDGPPARSTVNASSGTEFTLPKASVSVIRGRLQ
jgi:hypothetical protein